MTGIADALEARGLARRRPSEADRRVKALALTAKGTRLRERALGQLSEPPQWLRGLLRRAAEKAPNPPNP